MGDRITGDSSYKGLKGFATAVKESNAAGYGNDYKKYLSNKRAKSSDVENRRTQESGNAQSLLGKDRNTFG